MPHINIASEAEWLTLREQHIGGSEIASLFYEWLTPDGTIAIRHMFEASDEGDELLGCLGSFRSGFRLYNEKAGRVLPADFGASERVQAGKHLEPALAAWARERWDWTAMRKVHRYMTHPSVIGWGASLDYEVNEPGRPPVEFKNVDYGIWKGGWATDEDGEIIHMPLTYALQVQHEIGVAGSDHGYIVACVGGNALYRGRIERHEPTQAKIAAAIDAFWTAIAHGTEPHALADMDTIADLYAHGEKDKIADLTGRADVEQLIRRHLRWQRHMSRMKERTDNLKARICTHLGDATAGATDSWRLSWPSVTRAAGIRPAKPVEELTYRMGLRVSKVAPPKPARKTKTA